MGEKLKPYKKETKLYIECSENYNNNFISTIEFVNNIPCAYLPNK